MACPYYPLDLAYLQNFLAFTDCQARTLGAAGYAALSGSVAAGSITAMLTVFVALIGYRMMFGEVLGVRAGVLALVKIGIVLALTTGWQAYRTLAYDMVFLAPAQLVAVIGTGTGLPTEEGGLVARLDGVNRGFEALAIEGLGPRPDPQVMRTPPPLFNGFDVFAVGTARVAFLIQVIAAFAGLQLLAGLMLALGPFFIGFLLFDATRGLFVGWLRALLSVILGLTGAMLLFGIQLALFEPWLSDLLAQRAADQSIPGAAAQLLAAAFVFAIVLMTILAATTWVAWSLRFPDSAALHLRERFATLENIEQPASTFRSGSPGSLPEERSRAAVIVDAVAATQRRESGAGIPSVSATSGRVAPVGTGAPPEVAAQRDSLTPRRVANRVSATARRRDRIA